MSFEVKGADVEVVGLLNIPLEVHSLSFCCGNKGKQTALSVFSDSADLSACIYILYYPSGLHIFCIRLFHSHAKSRGQRETSLLFCVPAGSAENDKLPAFILLDFSSNFFCFSQSSFHFILRSFRVFQ